MKSGNANGGTRWEAQASHIDQNYTQSCVTQIDVTLAPGVSSEFFHLYGMILSR